MTQPKDNKVPRKSTTTNVMMHSPHLRCHLTTQRDGSNFSAPENMSVMYCTFDTSQLEISPQKFFAPSNMLVMSVTLDTSHFERSPSNDDAPRNIRLILVTRDTSHLEMSALNLSAPENKSDMSVRVDTSQSPIGPFGNVLSVPSGEDLSSSPTSILS